MKSFLLTGIAALFAAQTLAQSRIRPVRLTLLPEQFEAIDGRVSVQILSAGHRPAGKEADASGNGNGRPNLSFGFKGGRKLDRDLGFNNHLPGWMQYNLQPHINLFSEDQPAFRPNAHGIIPKTMEPIYRDAQDMQREPLPE